MDLKELLGEELAKQVEEKLGDKKLILNDGSYIPKSKFDEKNNEAKDLKAQIDARDKQLKELGVKAQGNDDLTAQIKALQEANTKAVEEYETRLKKQSFDFSLEAELMKARVKNAKAVRALLNTEAIKADGDKLLGLNEQLETLRKSDAYLFGDEVDTGSGANPPGVGHLSELQQLEAGYANAQKSGNLAMQVMYKNKIFEKTKI